MLDELLDRGTEITGKEAFDLFQSYGFPYEMTEEIAKEKGISIDKSVYEKEFSAHQEVSRAGMEKKFAGGWRARTILK